MSETFILVAAAAAALVSLSAVIGLLWRIDAMQAVGIVG